MKYHELDSFIKELEITEAFVTELAAREDELLSLGFGRVKGWSTFEAAVPVLKDFDRRLHGFLEFARAVDKSLHQSIAKIIDDTTLPDALGKLYISLKVASEKRPAGFVVELLNAFTFHLPYLSNRMKRKGLFSEESIPVQRILVALHRLTPLVKRVSDVYLANWHHNDEIFKPSNVHRHLVINYIEQAIVAVQAVAIFPDHKEKLLAYLNQTKNELAEDDVPWKKVIGALIVAATLLSGLADAPQAFDNVNKAIQHILGTSVEKLTPPGFPSPSPQDPYNGKAEPIRLA